MSLTCSSASRTSTARWRRSRTATTTSRWGRALAARLGYPTELLDQIPADALDSFAGVGYFLDLAAPQSGERVLDLGSGSGTDSFAAAALVGRTGQITGIDMTDAQLAKADRL